MPKVTMPMADWDALIYVLEEARVQGYLVNSLIADLQKQVYSQEY